MFLLLRSRLMRCASAADGDAVGVNPGDPSAQAGMNGYAKGVGFGPGDALTERDFIPCADHRFSRRADVLLLGTASGVKEMR